MKEAGTEAVIGFKKDYGQHFRAELLWPKHVSSTSRAKCDCQGLRGLTSFLSNFTLTVESSIRCLVDRKKGEGQLLFFHSLSWAFPGPPLYQVWLPGLPRCQSLRWAGIVTPWEPDRIVAECDKGQRTQEGLRISEGKETERPEEGGECVPCVVLVGTKSKFIEEIQRPEF